MTKNITMPRDDTRIVTEENASENDTCPGIKEASAGACAVYGYGNLKYTNDAPDSGIPSQLTHKDSWPLRRDVGIEANTYSPVYDEFGVPRLW
jgi:hypothetical protein